MLIYENMKKILVALGLFLILSASVYTGFKSGYQNGREDVLFLSAQGSVHEAMECFEEYKESEHESDYLYGVSAFKSFINSYKLLIGGDSSQSPSYTYCNELYGSMVLFPGKCQDNIDSLIDITSLLSEDPLDANAFIKVSELNNIIEK